MALGKWEGGVGEEALDESWAGRIRAVQWEANPKGGMEGAAGGVDKMSCETGVRMTQLGWGSCRPG